MPTPEARARMESQRRNDCGTALSLIFQSPLPRSPGPAEAGTPHYLPSTEAEAEV